jgi:RHS repeat-associated protein
LNEYQYEKVGRQDFGLKFFSQPEGYVASNSDIFSYIYQYKDHLGNNRLSYSDSNDDGQVTASEIIEEDNYYPFGLKHNGYNSVINGYNPARRYKYNGKELQEEFGLNVYDYGARNYDPALGRWLSPDALSEEYSDYSPYVYAFNDPVRHIDPDGNAPEDILGEIDPPGTKKSSSLLGTLKPLPVQKYQGGYVGQGLDELVTAGIQWLGGQISDSDVSKETSENVQLATTLLVVIVSKGKNAKADGEVVEQLTKAEARAAKLSKVDRSGKDFTKAGKEAVVDVNKAKNGGKTVCETCGTKTTPAKKDVKGTKPPKDRTEIDHINKKREGGSGTPDNGRVRCRGCNNADR